MVGPRFMAILFFVFPVPASEYTGMLPTLRGRGERFYVLLRTDRTNRPWLHYSAVTVFEATRTPAFQIPPPGHPRSSGLPGGSRNLCSPAHLGRWSGGSGSYR